VSTLEAVPERQTAADTVAGLLATASIVLSALGTGAGILLELEATPARTIPVAVVLAIVAGRMSARHSRLSAAAIWVASIAWVVGMTLAVLTENPLV
jgi:hypothetical protein